MFKPLDLSQMC